VNPTRKSSFLMLAVLLFIIVGLQGVTAAQSAGDYSRTWTYSPTDGTFCASGPNCNFTEVDVVAGSTTSSEVDVWTSIQIGSAMIANQWDPYAQAGVDYWYSTGSEWDLLGDNFWTQGDLGTSTARVPQSGYMYYRPVPGGYYYALGALDGVVGNVSGDYYYFDSWYKVTTGSYILYFWDGPPVVTQPATLPANYPGGTGTVTVTGSFFVDPFKGSGAAGVTPVSCSTGLTLTVNSWVYNSTTEVETVVLGYTVAQGTAPGTNCIEFKNHFGTSSPITFTVDAPPTIASVSPSTWDAGQSYPITITGTNFSPSSTVAVSVATGSVTLSNVKYVSATEITATVLPADTDPSETAVITVTDPSPAAVAAISQKPLANVSSVAPVGGAIYDASIFGATGKLYIIDPYLAPFSGSTSISQAEVISKLSDYSAIQANGLITDGTATAIAVYKSSVN